MNALTIENALAQCGSVVLTNPTNDTLFQQPAATFGTQLAGPVLLSIPGPPLVTPRLNPAEGGGLWMKTEAKSVC
jgi:hypothetical protein